MRTDSFSKQIVIEGVFNFHKRVFTNSLTVVNGYEFSGSKPHDRLMTMNLLFPCAL